MCTAQLRQHNFDREKYCKLLSMLKQRLTQFARPEYLAQLIHKQNNGKKMCHQWIKLEKKAKNKNTIHQYVNKRCMIIVWSLCLTLLIDFFMLFIKLFQRYGWDQSMISLKIDYFDAWTRHSTGNSFLIHMCDICCPLSFFPLLRWHHTFFFNNYFLNTGKKSP